MSGRVIRIRSIALAAFIVVGGACAGASTNPARADDCLAAPNSATPTGSHWYYHTDRAKGRKCWFLAPSKLSKQHTAAQVPSKATRAAQDYAQETAPQTAADAHTSTSADDGAPSVQPLEADSQPLNSATTNEPVQQTGQDEHVTASVPAAPAVPYLPSQTSGPAAGTASAATSVWPDVPAVTTVKAEKPNLIAGDARADDSVLPSTDGQTSDGSIGAARSGASTAQVSSVTAFSPDPFGKMLLVAVLGLIVAGFLFHLVRKIGVMRSRGVVLEKARSDWVDDLCRRERRDDRQPQGAAHGGEASIDELSPPLVPAEGDYSARRSLRAGGNRYNNAGGHVTGGVRGRETTLEQLLRDLDQMLELRKRA